MRDFKATPKKPKFPIFSKIGVAVFFLKSSVKRAVGQIGSCQKKPDASRMPEFDSHRRAFLRYAVFGGVALVVAKYAEPVINAIRGDTILSEKTFENFKITETGKQLRVTDDDGGEILTIDKESL